MRLAWLPLLHPTRAAAAPALVISAQLEESRWLRKESEGRAADRESLGRIKPVRRIIFQKEDGAHKRRPGGEGGEQSPGPLPQHSGSRLTSSRRRKGGSSLGEHVSCGVVRRQSPVSWVTLLRKAARAGSAAAAVTVG